jgi:hypothetical protein
MSVQQSSLYVTNREAEKPGILEIRGFSVLTNDGRIAISARVDKSGFLDEYAVYSRIQPARSHLKQPF